MPAAVPLLLLALSTICQSASSKRGLVYVTPDEDASGDDSIWLTEPTSLTWYYNYGSKPSPSISDTTSKVKLEFVPMLWGVPDGHLDFAADVRSLLDDDELAVVYVLSFNEPDMKMDVGGSDITPAAAAELWKSEIEPLAEDGLKLGAPGVSGTPGGKEWLKEFFENCKGCSVDFLALHWYGNFEGFSSYLGEMREMFPDKDVWVTEFGLPHAELEETYGFFNTSTEYLDRLEHVQRYSWFGSFRSDVSNVGPSGAMLNKDGELTNLGAWYLGRKATGNLPSAAGKTVFGWRGLAMALVAAGAVAGCM